MSPQRPWPRLGDLRPAPTVSLPLATNKTYTGTDAAGNPYVQVTVSWTFGTITGYVGIPKSVTLTRTVQMRQPQ